MKTIVLLLSLLPFSLLGFCAQTRPHAADLSSKLVQEANKPTVRQVTQKAISQQEGAFLNEGRYKEGYLYLPSGRRVLVPGLRYHVGLRVVEVQDSLQADSTTYWPLAALRGFDMGTENDSATVRRYRTHLVHQGGRPDQYEAVQVLTTTDTGPLLLAWLPVLLPGTSTPGLLLLAGFGHSADQPLRPFSPLEAELGTLLHKRAGNVRAFAHANNLHCCVPQEVAQMLDYYNHLVVAVQ